MAAEGRDWMAVYAGDPECVSYGLVVRRLRGEARRPGRAWNGCGGGGKAIRAKRRTPGAWVSLNSGAAHGSRQAGVKNGK